MTAIRTAFAATALTGLLAFPVMADVITGRTTLRTGPGPKYATIASLPRGAQVNASTCRAGWCRAEWRGQRGYVPSAAIAATGPSARFEGPWPRRGYGYSQYPDYWEGRFGRIDYAPSFGVYSNRNILD
ncbi:MAG: SH3 domain-containing protein [Hyphomicrobiales bacterium]